MPSEHATVARLWLALSYVWSYDTDVVAAFATGATVARSAAMAGA